MIDRNNNKVSDLLNLTSLSVHKISHLPLDPWSPFQQALFLEIHNLCATNKFQKQNSRVSVVHSSFTICKVYHQRAIQLDLFIHFLDVCRKELKFVSAGVVRTQN